MPNINPNEQMAEARLRARPADSPYVTHKEKFQ
jgi:hypothetical protein